MTQPEQTKPQGWGPYNAEIAADLYKNLAAWCENDQLHFKVNMFDVCEVIIPAIDSLAGIANPEKLGELLAVAKSIAADHEDCEDSMGDECQAGRRLGAALAAIGTLSAGDAP